MSLHGVYDSQNIFAKIIRGEAPCYKVYEDEDVLAFLDLFPQSYGHTLVIPKHAEARNLLEIDAQNLAKVMAVVQRLTRALVEEVQPDGVQVAQFNGAPPGRRSSTSISTSSRASAARISASMRRSRATRKCSHNFRSVWRSVCKADCAWAGPVRGRSFARRIFLKYLVTYCRGSGAPRFSGDVRNNLHSF